MTAVAGVCLRTVYTLCCTLRHILLHVAGEASFSQSSDLNTCD